MIRKIIYSIIFLSALISSVSAEVGIFYPDKVGGRGFGQEGIYEVLREAGLSVQYFSEITAAGVAPFEVLIFSTVHRVGTQPANWRRIIKDFAERGGGIFLAHDCVGYRHDFAEPLFPEVFKGHSRADLRKMFIKDFEHPITQGLPQEGKHAYYDHITMDPGEKGKVLVVNEKEKPILVVGRHGLGRIVGFGPPVGLNLDDMEMPPEGLEKAILINALRWLLISAEEQGGMNVEREIIILQQKLESLKNEFREEINKLRLESHQEGGQ